MLEAVAQGYGRHIGDAWAESVGRRVFGRLWGGRRCRPAKHGARRYEPRGL